MHRPPTRVRYGPGPWLYAHLGLCLSLAGYYFLRFSPLTTELVLAATLILGFGLYVFLTAWTRYDLDESGLTRTTLSGARSWSWEEIGAIRGREIQAGMHPALGEDAHAQPRGLGGDPMGQGVRHVVRDREGRTLFRISPWTRRRKELAREIRLRANEAAKSRP